MTSRAAGRALAVGALLVAVAAPLAHAGSVAVVVVPRIELEEAAQDGAVGLLVPGAGSTVTRAGAQSSLTRGKVTSSLLGGHTSGKPLIELATRPAQVTIYVTLPPPGKTHNVHRYPVAIVGGGYRGILTTDTTRIPGLLSIADIAPTAVALEQDERPRIRSRSDDHAAHTLHRLDERLDQAHDARTPATIVLVAWTLVLAGIAVIRRSRLFGRAALLAIPSALAVALALSGLHVHDPTAVTVTLALAVGPAALVAATAGRVALAGVLCAFLCTEIVVLAVWPDVNSLAAIGPHPDGGGRYYGITNEVETLLLAPVLGLAALAPAVWIAAVGVLSLVLVGWSRTGADGGGIVVVVAALFAFWCLRVRVRLTALRVVLGAIAIVGVAFAAVAIDAATGGSSHVTDAVGTGPGSLLGDLGHRLHVSWQGVTATTQAGVAAGLTLMALIGLAALRDRVDVVDAFLVGLAVSLLVNDTPTDVLAFGALAAAALRAWATLDHAPSARSVAAAFPPAWQAPLGR